MHKLTKALIISTILSFVTYLGSCLLLPAYVNVSSFTFDFVWKIALLTAISWVPIWFFDKVKKKYYPTDHERIMKSARMQTFSKQAQNGSHNWSLDDDSLRDGQLPREPAR